jgi:hypothetical protein
MAGAAQIRQVLFGIHVTLFGGILAILAPSAAGIGMTIAVVGLLVSVIEPRRPQESGPAPATLADERHEDDGTR